MSLTFMPAAVDTSALAADIAAAKATAKAAHDVAVKAEADAKAADEKAANARTMVLNRDPVLNDLKATAGLFGSTTAAADAIHGELAERIDEVRDALAAIQLKPGPDGKPGANGLSAYELARTNGYGGTMTQWLASLKGADGLSIKGDTGAPGTPADMTRVTALENDVAALKALKVMVGFGVANLPASLAAGASANVTVTLSRSMGSAQYSVGYGLAGGTSLLGNLQAVGVVSQTATTVVVTIKNNGLVALLNLSTASLSVVAARDA